MNFDFDFLYGDNYLKWLFIAGVIFILMAVSVFVFPGLERGIDLTGGNMLIVTSNEQIDARELESLLLDKFDLSDLSVVSFSSPTSKGARITYAFDKEIQTARVLVSQGDDIIATNPTQAFALYNQAQEELGDLVPVPFIFDNELVASEEAGEMLSIASENFQKQLQDIIKQEFGLSENVSFQKREIGAQLGAVFWESALNVSIIAGFLLIASIFVFFRKVIPSLAIIAAAIYDVLGALTGMALLGVPLSIATIPALLMLVGYSVDTDIMLTSRLLREKDEDPRTSAKKSIKTGLTMTLTSMAAITAMMAFSFFNQMFVMFEISIVIFFGLLADLISTWFMNAPILIWYVKKMVRSD